MRDADTVQSMSSTRASSAPAPSGADESGLPPEPPRLRPLGVILLALEAAALAVLAVLMLSRAGSGDMGESFAIALGVFIAVFALGVALAARSLARRGRFGTGFGITWQLFQALVSASMLNYGIYVPGAIGLVLAIAAFVVLLQLVRTTPLPYSEEENGQRRRESDKAALIEELRGH